MTEALSQFNEVLLNELLPTVGAFVALYLIKFIVPAVRSVCARLNLEYDSRNDAKIQFVVEKWVRYAEEHVEQLYRTNVVAKEEKGLLKMETAIAGIIDDIPGVSPELAKVLATAALTKLGLGAAVKGVDFLEEQLKVRLPENQRV